VALVSMNIILRDAKEKGYAVCYLESWNLESLLAVVDAAEECNSPIIIGFCGDYLAHTGRLDKMPLEYFASIGEIACRLSRIPTAFMLNESSNFPLLLQAMKLGFNTVMMDDHELSWKEKIMTTKELVKIAHSLGVSVEAEVGELRDAICRQDGKMGIEKVTDPKEVNIFVKETGVDAIAISIGSVHTLLSGKAKLDFKLLDKICHNTDIPLVLHGGTGVDVKDLKRACLNGISKVNVGAVLKSVFYNAIKDIIDDHKDLSDPHLFFGCGVSTDLMTAGRMAMKKKAIEFIEISGSVGKGNGIIKKLY